MDPLEFVPIARDTGDFDLTGFNEFGKSIQQWFSDAASPLRYINFAAVCAGLITTIMLFRVFNAAIVPGRQPIAFKYRIILRVPTLAALLYLMPGLVLAAQGKHLLTAVGVQYADIVFKFGCLIENTIAFRANIDANSCVYSFGEFSLISEMFRREAIMGPGASTIAVYFYIISLASQIAIQLEGLFDCSQHFRLLSSCIGTIGYFLLYCAQVHQSKLITYSMLTVFSTCRLLPLALMATAMFTFWIVCRISLLVFGSENTAALRCLQAYRFQSNHSISTNLIGLCVCLFIMQRENQAPSIYLPRGPYSFQQNPPTQQPESTPINPLPEYYGNARIALLALLGALKLSPLEETEEDDHDYQQEESDFESEYESETESLADGQLTVDSITISGVSIWHEHNKRGRITRSEYAKIQSTKYLEYKQSQHPDQRSGPETCVVCLDSPRDVVLWPCGCLCMCSDCRNAVSLQNKNECVCCRRKITGFSKIFRP